MRLTLFTSTILRDGCLFDMETSRPASLHTKLVIYVISIFFLSCSSTHSISDTEKGYQIKNLINSRSYQFKARFVTPLGGKQIALTSEYLMQVSPERIDADLPYFGEAYSAPIGPGESGVNFSSTNFRYDIEDTRNGWTITIEPEDTRDVRKLALSVTQSGAATLQVFSNYKQLISYSGTVIRKPDGR